MEHKRESLSVCIVIRFTEAVRGAPLFCNGQRFAVHREGQRCRVIDKLEIVIIRFADDNIHPCACVNHQRSRVGNCTESRYELFFAFLLGLCSRCVRNAALLADPAAEVLPILEYGVILALLLVFLIDAERHKMQRIAAEDIFGEVLGRHIDRLLEIGILIAILIVCILYLVEIPVVRVIVPVGDLQQLLHRHDTRSVLRADFRLEPGRPHLRDNRLACLINLLVGAILLADRLAFGVQPAGRRAAAQEDKLLLGAIARVQHLLGSGKAGHHVGAVRALKLFLKLFKDSLRLLGGNQILRQHMGLLIERHNADLCLDILLCRHFVAQRGCGSLYFHECVLLLAAGNVDHQNKIDRRRIICRRQGQRHFGRIVLIQLGRRLGFRYALDELGNLRHLRHIPARFLDRLQRFVRKRRQAEGQNQGKAEHHREQPSDRYFAFHMRSSIFRILGNTGIFRFVYIIIIQDLHAKVYPFFSGFPQKFPTNSAPGYEKRTAADPQSLFVPIFQLTRSSSVMRRTTSRSLASAGTVSQNARAVEFSDCCAARIASRIPLRTVSPSTPCFSATHRISPLFSLFFILFSFLDKPVEHLLFPVYFGGSLSDVRKPCRISYPHYSKPAGCIQTKSFALFRHNRTDLRLFGQKIFLFPMNRQILLQNIHFSLFIVPDRHQTDRLRHWAFPARRRVFAPRDP